MFNIIDSCFSSAKHGSGSIQGRVFSLRTEMKNYKPDPEVASSTQTPDPWLGPSPTITCTRAEKEIAKVP